MILFARKKLIRDERLLQIMFILSLLRGSPDYILDGRYLDNDLFHDLSLGTSIGHSRLSTVFSSNELHPKSMDRVLANYQRSLLHDLNYLGSNEGRNFLNTRYNFFTSYPQSIQAYLFNTDSTIGPPMTAPPLEEGGYVSGPSSPDPMDEPMQWPNQDSSFPSDWHGTDDLFEDIELLETYWKQDVDMGIPRGIFEDVEDEDEAMEEIASKFPYLYDASKDSNPENEPPGGGGIKELGSNDEWTPFNFTIDAETGELIATNSSSDTVLDGEGPVLSFNPSANQGTTQRALSAEGNLHLEFNLDEALKLVGLGTEPPQELPDSEADSGCGDSGASDSGGDSGIASLDTLNESLDDMIQASQLHPHHPRNFQGRLGNLVRGGSMEQRWQDLASLLSLPSPDPSHHVQSPPTPTMASHATSPVHIHAHPPPSIHHPHALYPTHEVSPVVASSSPGIPRGVLVHSASIPPTMSDGHNITYTNSIGASSHLVASSMNLTNNTEITTSDHHHYKMETSSSLPPEMMYYQNSGAEMNQTTDGFLSSILSDEDLQLMDIPMTDYNGRATNDYGGGPYRYPPPEDPHRLPQVAQKKHQMFGKRFFHDNPHSNHAGHNNLTGNGVPSPIVAYPPHYQSPQGNQPMEGATAMDPSEMKYSCSMDFRSPVPEVSGAAVEHVQHNHTYHLSPDGSSGMNRSHGRDRKGRKSELEKSLTRDEKRARSMNLPITCEDIINLPMDEFNERISKFDLTEAQLALIRDIRRRGKNKVAAQNCRKRKLDQIVHLAEEVKVIQYRKNELCSQLDHYTAERARIKHKFSLLYRHIFQSLRDPEGNPYSPHEYSLQQSADGGILLVPRSSPPPHNMDQINKGRMPKDDGGGH